jgi:pyridoxal phosphate enzyme (YggS family)
MMILSREKLQENLDKLIWDIEEARIKRSEHLIVQLVVVSKYTETENIKTLYELGQRAFGENQVQKLQERMEALEDLPLAWHMIGTLQKNKINKLIDLNPILFQALDSIDLARELNKRLEAKGKTMDTLMQINSSYEPTKSGVKPEEALEVYEQIQKECPNINLKGVMTIGAHSEDEKEIRKSFELTYDIFEKLKNKGATICSMGMSGDFKIAIECGSNMVRIGSRLFQAD